MTLSLTEALERAEQLLPQLSVAEKAQQVTGVMPIGLLGPDGLLVDVADRMLGDGIGHIAPLGMFNLTTPLELAKATNAIQRHLVEHTRLGIPAIFHVEALHGVVSPGCTSFPAPIGLAATWDPDAVEEMGRVIRRQARALGHPFLLSPVLDVARDARWGRVHETYGEDPYLVSAMGVAFVRGTQGDDLATGVIATGKHFLGYGLTEAGQNMARSTISDRELYEVYGRPFEAAIAEAGLGSVMNSYSTVDGIPAGASRRLLTHLLRDRMGFEGTVVSDYDTVRHLQDRLHVAADAEEAAGLALAAGLDVELPCAYGYGPVLAAAVTAGRIPMADLDRAVVRVLRDKFALGLFERPYAEEDPIAITEATSAGAELSARLAEESVTVLTNDGVLPLTPDVGRIAVIGPHSADISLAFGPYTFPGALQLMLSRFRGDGRAIPGTEHHTTDVPDAAVQLMLDEYGPLLQVPIDDVLREQYGARTLADAVRETAPGAHVDVVPGCGIAPEDPQDLAAAVRAAEAADVVILALGGRAGWFTAGITEGEGSDTADIDLPAQQVALVRAVTATGTPAVAVVNSGRPMALTSIVDEVGAVVLGYHGGQAGSGALARVLFGAVEPSGKLAMTLPRHSGQVPIYAGQHVGSGQRRTAGDMHTGYLDLGADPLFAFGHGLSYTTFAYDDLVLSASAITAEGAITVSAGVRNTGERAGTEVVQLYFSDRATGLTRPALELVAFARVPLQPGERREVAFTVAMSQLGYVGLDGDVVLEPGPIEVHVGAASDDLRLCGVFEVVGETVRLQGARSHLASVTLTP